MRTLGPRRPMGDSRPQEPPPEEKTMKPAPEPREEEKPKAPASYRAYQSAIRRHEDALSRIRRREAKEESDKKNPS